MPQGVVDWADGLQPDTDGDGGRSEAGAAESGKDKLCRHAPASSGIRPGASGRLFFPGDVSSAPGPCSQGPPSETSQSEGTTCRQRPPQELPASDSPTSRVPGSPSPQPLQSG